MDDIIDVKALCEKLGLTEEQFAREFMLQPGLVRQDIGKTIPIGTKQLGRRLRWRRRQPRSG